MLRPAAGTVTKPDRHPPQTMHWVNTFAAQANSQHISAHAAGHYVHLDEPDLVIQAILDLVRRCR
jgi:pimeloyl-ACP methyl ester carboxylesterase